MPRLTDFAGFEIKKSGKGLFNPFDDSPPRPKPQPEIHIQEIKEETPIPFTETHKEERKVVEELESVLKPTPEPEDTTTFIELFPKQEQSTAIIPMIQPRSKEGQRLLYKFPNLPTIPAKEGPKDPYWLLVGQADRSESAWLIQFDGAANPNPGPASSGAVLWSPRGSDGKRSIVFESGKFLGKATNNIAESQGLLLGLQIAVMRGARELLIEGDSELIVFQQIGKYQVKDRNLKVWWAQIQAAMMDEGAFDWIAIRQVRREFNERADSITKEVLSRREGFQRA